MPPGTTAALALLNDQVKKGRHHGVLLCGRLKRRFHSGERGSGHDRRGERRGADAGEAGSHDLCVLRRSGYDRHSRRHHTGSTISGIIADEMAIGMINQKTTAVRVIPVIGKGVGGDGGIRRPAGLCTHHAGESVLTVMRSSTGAAESRHRYTASRIRDIMSASESPCWHE